MWEQNTCLVWGDLYEQSHVLVMRLSVSDAKTGEEFNHTPRPPGMHARLTYCMLFLFFFFGDTTLARRHSLQ
jgi:hypothetical protein